MPSASDRLGQTRTLLLIVICAVVFLPGIGSLPPVDRDEARFVQATRQMAETGDFVDIRLQDVSRYKKPIGIYWLQSAAVMISGQGADAAIWVYRIVSVFGATIAVLATAWIGAWLFGSSAGLVAGIGLAGILMLGFEARIAKTDAMLLAAAAVGQAALARVYVGNRLNRPVSDSTAWLFWLAQGVGILLKGPIIPFLALLTVGGIAIFDREFSWLKKLKPVAGIGLAMLIVAPWLVLITQKSGSAFWQESLGRDALGKVTSGQESHGAPPGYYFLIFSVFMWPFALMALDGGLRALNRFRDDPRLLFCVAWYLPIYLVFELVPTKLPHYLLPAYPALMLLMGWSLCTPSVREISLRRWQVWLRHLALFGVVLVSFSLAVIAVGITPYLLGTWSLSGVLAGIAVLATGWLGTGWKPDFPAIPRVVAMTAGAALTFGLLTTMVLPNLKLFWLSPRIAEAIEIHKTCPNPRLVSAGFHEPSLVFLTRTDTVLTSAEGAAEALTADDDCVMALIEEDQRRRFVDVVAAGSKNAVAVTRIEGINYSKGKALVLTLFRMEQ